jgi:hypothetical protein
VFGTIAAESQRLINETYSAFVQGFMPTLARPDVDVLDGITAAISVDRSGWGPTPAPPSAPTPTPTPTRCCASCSAGSRSRTSARPDQCPLAALAKEGVIVRTIVLTAATIRRADSERSWIGSHRRDGSILALTVAISWARARSAASAFG